MRAGKVSDRFLTVLALVGISMPVFWIGALMNHYLGFELSNTLGFELFPNGGYVPFTENPAEWLHHLILPWTALSILFIGVYSRVLRGNILETMNEDFVRTARAKGLSERQVLLKHVLRNSLIPVVTLWGLDFAVVIGGGAILTETVFNLQGVGQYAADAIGQLDQPPILAVTCSAPSSSSSSTRSSTSPTRRSTRASGSRAERRPRDGGAAAPGRGPRVCVPDRGGHRQGRRRRLLRRRARRGARDRRRVRLRQVGDRDDADGPDARPERADHRHRAAAARPS